MTSLRCVLLLSLICGLCWPAKTADYLFVYFQGNGETGAHFALSQDGYRWDPVNQGKPWIPVEQEGELMRDPSIARGPDGEFHMVWTWNWTGTQFGYASSKDLVHWSAHRAITPFLGVRGVLNIWAPEIFWDAAARQWIVYWSSTIEGRFPETQGQAGRYNHRLYYMTTQDFQTFSEPRVLLDPGFIVIDGTIFENAGRYYMIIKDETEKPLRKYLQLVSAPTPYGPWSGPSAPITRGWSEGPSALKIGDDWVVYYDHYRMPRRYEAVRSRDLNAWEDVTHLIRMPPEARHGSFLKITEEEAGRLKAGRP